MDDGAILLTHFFFPFCFLYPRWAEIYSKRPISSFSSNNNDPQLEFELDAATLREFSNIEGHGGRDGGWDGESKSDILLSGF
ncbi:MAG: hypothetical protein ACI8RD_012689 [Bacillariaceae sp.]|jgi:hypothetical protein